MQKFTAYALTGALLTAISGTTVLVTVEAASAKTRVPPCEKVVLSSDKTIARQTISLWSRLGPLSGMCGAPK